MLAKNLFFLSCFILFGTNIAKADVVMSQEDKLISMATLVKYAGRGGLMEFSQQDYLMLLDIALQQGYKPGPALLQALAEQPELLEQTQQRVKAHQ